MFWQMLVLHSRQTFESPLYFCTPLHDFRSHLPTMLYYILHTVTVMFITCHCCSTQLTCEGIYQTPLTYSLSSALSLAKKPAHSLASPCETSLSKSGGPITTWHTFTNTVISFRNYSVFSKIRDTLIVVDTLIMKNFSPL